MKRTTAVLCLFLLALLSAYAPGAEASFDSGKAVSYLLNHKGNPWVMMALASNGTPVTAGDLKLEAAQTALDYSAPILALAAVGQDPRNFNNENYLEKLLGFRNNGQLGDPELINDDIFGLLALSAAGVPASDELIRLEKEYLLKQQGADAGWGYALSAESDSNTTAAAILALLAAGLDKTDPVITGALAFLKSSQNEDGGFAYQPNSPWGSASDSSSTAWALWAINATDSNPIEWARQNTPTRYLETQQNESGFFSYQTGSLEDSFSSVTTAYALIALNGKFLPIARIAPSTQGVDFRIEGSAQMVCSGTSQAANPLEVVVEASGICGFDYVIRNSSFGQYLESVGDDKAVGMEGWMYLVNYISPSVGAADYALKQGDQLVWFFGEYDLRPMRISLEKTQSSVTALVEQLEENFWVPSGKAEIIAGSIKGYTDEYGKAVLTLNDGVYQVWAEKPGSVRSSRVRLVVGSGGTASSSVELKARLVSGQVEGLSLGILVSPSIVDFGNLRQGESRSQSVTIENIGDAIAQVTAEVTGDEMFKNNMRIGSSAWNSYKVSLGQGRTISEKLNIDLPPGYSASTGAKAGGITFWATGQ